MDDAKHDQQRLDELRSLVVAAFDQARRGKSAAGNWHLMRSAVLKNRLIQITNGDFKNSEFGSKPMTDVAMLLPDLLQVHSTNPTVFEFLQPDLFEVLTATIPEDAGTWQSNDQELGAQQDRFALDHISFTSSDWETVRVRDDLWRSILDYSSSTPTIWDAEQGIARARQLMDLPETPALPTLDKGELERWRLEYAETLKAEVAHAEAEKIASWVTGSGALATLPKRFRAGWIELLKRRVADRLIEWFNSNSIPVPPDIFIRAEARGRTSDTPTMDEVVRTRRLRGLLVSALQQMTYEEMSDLRIPASVLVRLNVRF